MAPDFLIRRARLVDPSQGWDTRADVAIRHGRIAAIGVNLPAGEAEEVVADRCLLAPAFVDAHVHLRDLGQAEKETVASGTAAAAAGGFGAVACMANTIPTVDSPSVLAALAAVIQRDALVPVHPVAALTRGLEGQELTDLERLAAGGAVAFSDDGRNAAAPDLLAEGLRRAAKLQRPVLVHAELEDRTRGALLDEGRVAGELRVPGWPRAAETEAVEQALWALRRAPGAHLHLQHLSTQEAVSRVRAARAAGERVTAEATPHHLGLTDAAALAQGALAKVNPPLREEGDRQALLEGLLDRTITVIASDHAPHEASAKADLASAAFGIAGLETAVALCLGLPIPRAVLVAALTTGPQAIVPAAGGGLRVGAPAHCVLIDPELECTVGSAGWRSRGRNTPLWGRPLKGRVLMTWVAGRLVHRAEVPVA